MSFQFNKSEFQAQEDWGFETVGIFGTLPAMKGKRLQFTKKNLKNEDRSIALQIFPKKYDNLSEAIADKATECLVCTRPLSKLIRKGISGGVNHNKMLSYLLSLEVQTNIDNPKQHLLFSEKGDGEQLPAFLVDDLAKEKVSYEDILDSAAF
jgi:hypothetical protein